MRMTGYTKKLAILPFDHRSSYISELFGWKEPPTTSPQGYFAVMTLRACRGRIMILSIVSALHVSMNDARLVGGEPFLESSCVARCV